MVDKDDVELIDLLRKLKITIPVIIIFSVLLITILIKKFNSTDTELIKKIKNNESLYILVYDNKCDKCKQIKEILKEKKIYYYEINTNKDKNYNKTLKELNMKEYEIISPTLLYINEGKLSVSAIDIKNAETIDALIENGKTNNQ